MLLLPEPIRQARINLEEHPWRSIFLGILNFTGAAIILALMITLVSNNCRSHNNAWVGSPLSPVLIQNR